MFPMGLAALTVLAVLGLAGLAVASPAPVSACLPCDDGFVSSAANHGLDTEVSRGEALVQAHENGSATWTVTVVPTNETVLAPLAGNRTLARAVAADSFGTRYGAGIQHELIGATVVDDAFVIRYRTPGVVRETALGTRTLTYFRDSPGAYVYTGLGADELTVVAPTGMTVARGFGDVDGRRMAATGWPDVRDGPFVVFAADDAPTPGLLGVLAVAGELSGVIARNIAFFVALPGGLLVGGLAVIRRIVDATRAWDSTRLGGLVTLGGVLVLLAAVVSEGAALPAVTGNLLVGMFAGGVLLVLGVAVTLPVARRHVTGLRLVGIGIAAAVVAVTVSDGFVGSGGVHRSLSLALALLPVAVALGWLDALDTPLDRTYAYWLFLGTAVAVFGVLTMSAPLTALGGSLFLLVPILLTVASVGVVVAAVPLYLLGAAGAHAESG